MNNLIIVGNHLERLSDRIQAMVRPGKWIARKDLTDSCRPLTENGDMSGFNEICRKAGLVKETLDGVSGWRRTKQ